MSNESLIEAIAGCISKHMTVQLYPREVLAAAREIAEKYGQQRIAEMEKDAAQKPHCTEGDHCLCGGDTDAVRKTCDNWRDA